MIEFDTTPWRNLPPPQPAPQNKWQFTNAYKQGYAAPSVPGSSVSWNFGNSTWPNYASRTIYLNLGDSTGHCSQTNNPPVTETLTVQVPRDPNIYTVTIPLMRWGDTDTPVSLRQPYQPQANDVLTFTLVSVNNPYPQVPYGSAGWSGPGGFDYARGMTIGNFTGPYPHGLFLSA